MDKLDEVFGLLGIEQRRYALYYLQERGEPVSVSELAMTVQEWEAGISSPESVDEVDDSIAIQLKHRDIPKLRKAEYIEYDPETKEIEISGMPAEVKVLLSVTEAIEQPREDDIAHM